MDNKQNKKEKSGIFQKIKSIKHFEIIVAVMFCAIILVIYISTLNVSTNSEVKTTSLTAEEYAKLIEDKMSNVLSNVNGAGKVSVMVTLECGIEYIYATSIEEVSNTSGTTIKTTTSEDIVLVSNSGKSSPIVLKQNLPKISGVIITAQGAGNIAVKLELMKAVQALFDLPNENVEILIGK